MTEPVTTYKTLIVPNTGDLPGAWGTSAMNPNFQLIDSMFGGQATLSLNGATTIVLTVPPTSGIWNSSNPQCSQASLQFVGTPGADATITFTLPGHYIISNACTPSNFVIILNPSAGGRAVCAPPGRCMIWYDGTNIDYVGLGLPGTALDLQGWTAVPRWISQSNPMPYLLKDGTSYSTASYQWLAFTLKGAFGNSDPVGVSFNVPDERARARIAFDTGGLGRLTSAGCGINGALMGSAGGSEFLTSHTHSNTLSDPGHLHSGVRTDANSNPFDPGVGGFVGSPGNTGSATTGISITNASSGAGGSNNVQPSIISFLPLIKV